DFRQWQTYARQSVLSSVSTNGLDSYGPKSYLVSPHHERFESPVPPGSSRAAWRACRSALLSPVADIDRIEEMDQISVDVADRVGLLQFCRSLQFVTHLADLRQAKRCSSTLHVVTQRTNRVEVGAGERGRDGSGVPPNVVEKLRYDCRKPRIHDKVELRY